MNYRWVHNLKTVQVGEVFYDLEEEKGMSRFLKAETIKEDMIYLNKLKLKISM